MIVKYEIALSRFSRYAIIRPIEVERETESSVWVHGKRRAKRSSYENYFDTWEKAKEELLADALGKVNNARRSLESCQGYLGNVKGLKEKV